MVKQKIHLRDQKDQPNPKENLKGLRNRLRGQKYLKKDLKDQRSLKKDQKGLRNRLRGQKYLKKDLKYHRLQKKNPRKVKNPRVHQVATKIIALATVNKLI